MVTMITDQVHTELEIQCRSLSTKVNIITKQVLDELYLSDVYVHGV
jgi:hypothetical protein